MGGRENKWRACRLAARDGVHDGWESRPNASQQAVPAILMSACTGARDADADAVARRSIPHGAPLRWVGLVAVRLVHSVPPPRLASVREAHSTGTGGQRRAPECLCRCAQCAHARPVTDHSGQWAVGSGQWAAGSARARELL